jgi:hypothetical protein
VTEAVAAVTLAAADNMTFFWLPGTRLNVAGAAVTPAGSPLTAILTLDVKVLTAATLTVTV